jgi:hypothetical protein
LYTLSFLKTGRFLSVSGLHRFGVMHTWTRNTVFAWQEPPYDDAHIESPQDAIDVVRVTLRACQRALHGPFSAAGDAVMLEPAIEAQLRRAVAAAGRMSRAPSWFEERVAAYSTGHEWVDGHRIQRDRVPDRTELYDPAMRTAIAARERLRGVARAVERALEPWCGIGQSCMTRDALAAINDALLAYDAAATEHYRVFELFRAERSAEIQHAWQVVATEPDIPVFQPPGD